MFTLIYLIFLSPLAVFANPSFSFYLSTYGKAYTTTQEKAAREKIFLDNIAVIEAHNAKNLSWKMGINSFSDLSPDEFKARFTGGFQPRKLRRAKVTERGHVTIPPSVNWVAEGAVTPVKNQGGCGSCWAFSATGAIESSVYIKTKTLHDLSEQQIVDCDKKGNGCGGGSMESAFDYVKANKGQCSEREYPYTGKDGACKGCSKVAEISGYKNVPQDNELALLSAIVNQPVSVGIEADQSSFQHYKSGYLTSACGTKLDHGVLAVGYDEKGYSELFYGGADCT